MTTLHEIANILQTVVEQTANTAAETIFVPATLAGIAVLIQTDWKNINTAAAHHLEAMFQLTGITDTYITESAKTVVKYFLANASAWKGPIAKVIKKHLKDLTK